MRGLSDRVGKKAPLPWGFESLRGRGDLSLTPLPALGGMGCSEKKGLSARPCVCVCVSPWLGHPRACERSRWAVPAAVRWSVVGRRLCPLPLRERRERALAVLLRHLAGQTGGKPGPMLCWQALGPGRGRSRCRPYPPRAMENRPRMAVCLLAVGLLRSRRGGCQGRVWPDLREESSLAIRERVSFCRLSRWPPSIFCWFSVR